MRAFKEEDGIVQLQENHIATQDKIIAKYEKLDQNNQTIDTRGQEISAVWREQHTDDKRMITDLQQDLDSCRNNQKWIALIAGAGGTYVGYKIRGAGQLQNPFVVNPAPGFLNIQTYQSTAEERVRQALKAAH